MGLPDHYRYQERLSLMATAFSPDIDPAFERAVRAAVIGLGEGDTRVLDLDLEQIEDLTGKDAWRVTLFLPVPDDRVRGWDAEKTLLLRRDTRWRVDKAAAEHRCLLDGVVSVVITTRDASPEDIADDGEPQPGEGFDRELDQDDE